MSGAELLRPKPALRARRPCGRAVLFALTLAALPGCGKGKGAEVGSGGAPAAATSEPDALTRPIELEAAFVLRAARALDAHRDPKAPLIEVRASGRKLEMQWQNGDAVMAAAYEESPPLTQLAPPEPRIVGPGHVPVYGVGNLGDNAFPASELDLTKVVAAFDVAKKAVDPADGRVFELVARRNLPFGTAVRARIYVDSPRMSGSIDTNGSGVPLKN